MNTRTTRRRTPQFLPWVAAGIASVAISSCLALTVWNWLQEDEMESLRASLEVQQQEHSTAETLLVTSQSTATAQEQRLAALEGSAQLEGSATLDTSAENSTPLQEI